MEVNGDSPIYTNGDYRIFRWSNQHYLHTFKNIIIAQRVGANKALINDLVNDIKPTNESDYYHNYDRPKAAIQDGIKAAKKLHFTIN